MPILYMNIMTIGVWNESPKINGMMIAKLSHSVSRSSGSKSSHSLNHKSASIAFGRARNSQTKNPARNRPRLIGR